jgi:hypothetical protein
MSKAVKTRPKIIPVPKYCKPSGSSKKKFETDFAGILLNVVENVKPSTSPEFRKAIGLNLKKLDPFAFPP